VSTQRPLAATHTVGGAEQVLLGRASQSAAAQPRRQTWCEQRPVIK